MSQPYPGPNAYANQADPRQRGGRPGQYAQAAPGDDAPVYSRAQVLAWQRKQMDMLQQSLEQAQARARKRSHRTAAITALIGLAVGLLVALGLARFVFGLGSVRLDPIAPTLSEAELSEVVGAYSYDGESFDITARDAITGTQALSYSLNADGTYDAPSSDMVLSYARNQVLAKLVADAGISVSDEEVTAYMQQLLGTTDLTQAAALLHMDADQASDALTAACGVSKLKQTVCPAGVEAIPAPSWPEDGNTELGHPEYADYIISLLGADWDAVTMSWANTDNPYYAALKDAVFAQGSASYEAAMLAYDVAVQQAGGAAADSSVAWTDYVNEYLDKAAIAVYTLRA